MAELTERKEVPSERGRLRRALAYAHGSHDAAAGALQDAAAGASHGAAAGASNDAAAGASHGARSPARNHDAPFTSTDEIPGTYIFDGALAMKGYALNKMCYSFNEAKNREAFRQDPAAYCAKFGLTAEQRDAVERGDVLAMIRAGGNVYYLAKLAGIFGYNVQDIGAQQTGMTVEAFRRMLEQQGEPHERPRGTPDGTPDGPHHGPPHESPREPRGEIRRG